MSLGAGCAFAQQPPAVTLKDTYVIRAGATTQQV